MSCKFIAQTPAKREFKLFPLTPDGFRNAVDETKRLAKWWRGSADLQITCPGQEIFILTCGEGSRTCDTRYSARPHGGLGKWRRKR